MSASKRRYQVYSAFWRIVLLNLINHAKEYCDYLIVGVNSDELVETYKHKTPVVHQDERMKIVENIKAVDHCILVSTLDKVMLWNQLHFNAVFIGDDWKGHPRWMQTETDLEPLGVKVIYLPYTSNVSSSMLRLENIKRVKDC